jgi:DNA-binding NtrC family response regulator
MGSHAAPALSPEVAVSLKLLAIDHDPQDLALIRSALSHERVQILTASDAESALELFRRNRPNLIFLDLAIPGTNGVELLEKIVEMDPAVDVILMTAHYSTDRAVEAIRKGACDYLTKPLDMDRLRARVSALVADAERRRRTLQLERELLGQFEFQGIIGRNPLMLEVFAKIRRVAPHFRVVLVTGATGTGKELVAQALHRLSASASGPFAVCNCSALVETLLESELFGYVRGAFTGATQDKIGIFEFANGGTVFLDEIGELPLTAQAKLLRVLQNQEVQRVGSPAVRKIDVRIIAATHRDLRTMAREGRFREDLYYRLAMAEITLPLLLERREDLPLLQRHFVEKFAREYHKQITGITRRAQMAISRYSWPGNIRELENVIGNACMMVEGSVIDLGDLPQQLRSESAQAVKSEPALLSLAEVQEQHVKRVLESVQGNKARAAEILGIGRSTLYQLLAKMRGNGNSA